MVGNIGAWMPPGEAAGPALTPSVTDHPGSACRRRCPRPWDNVGADDRRAPVELLRWANGDAGEGADVWNLHERRPARGNRRTRGFDHRRERRYLNSLMESTRTRRLIHRCFHPRHTDSGVAGAAVMRTEPPTPSCVQRDSDLRRRGRGKTPRRRGKVQLPSDLSVGGLVVRRVKQWWKARHRPNRRSTGGGPTRSAP